MDIIQMGGRLLLSFILGAVIGLEREINEKKTSNKEGLPSALLGLRSFSLTAVFGAVTGFIYLKSMPLALLIGSGYILLLLIFYYLDSNTSKDIGLTTELAALYSYAIGILIALNVFPSQLTIAVTVMVILLLSQKERIKDVVEDVGRKELNALISYAILAAVIMPFLPNVNYSISDFGELSRFLKNLGVSPDKIINVEIINPFKTWLILVLVTGVDLISYVLARIFGNKKSRLITSAIGGFVSSTATTQSIAQESKTLHKTNYLLASATLANLVSFFQIAFLIGLINGVFLLKLSKILLLMIVAGTLLIVFFLKNKENRGLLRQKIGKVRAEIIDLPGALRFAGLYLFISILAKFALSLFGGAGLMLATGIGALIGLDAVMVNTAQLAGGKVAFELAIFAFVIANTVNLTAKSIYSLILGSKNFSQKFSLSMFVIVGASIIGLILT